MDLIKDFSNYIDVYAIDNNAFIEDEDNKLSIHGNCFLFRKGKMKKICKLNRVQKLNSS